MRERRVTVMLLAVAVATVAIAVVPAPDAVARPLAVAFWLIVPGWAATAVLLTGPMALRLCGAVTVSATAGILMAQAMAMTRLWAPAAASAAVAAISAATLAAELAGRLPVGQGVEGRVRVGASHGTPWPDDDTTARPSRRLLALLAFVIGITLGGAIQYVLVLLR